MKIELVYFRWRERVLKQERNPEPHGVAGADQDHRVQLRPPPGLQGDLGGLQPRQLRHHRAWRGQHRASGRPRGRAPPPHQGGLSIQPRVKVRVYGECVQSRRGQIRDGQRQGGPRVRVHLQHGLRLPGHQHQAVQGARPRRHQKEQIWPVSRNSPFSRLHLEILTTRAMLSAAWAGHGPGQGASRINISEKYWWIMRTGSILSKIKWHILFQLCQSLPFARQKQGWKEKN